MNPILRNILGLIVGAVVGGIVNMSLIQLGVKVVPLPEGASLENMAEYIHLFDFKNFIFPFLAHAFGTLTGAFIAAKIAATHKMKFALAIGVLFLFGGVMMVRALPGSPMWFNMLDLIGAYIPMALLGAKFAGKEQEGIS